MNLSGSPSREFVRSLKHAPEHFDVLTNSMRLAKKTQEETPGTACITLLCVGVALVIGLAFAAALHL